MIRQSWEQQLSDRLSGIMEQGLERNLLPLETFGGAHIAYKGQEYLNLASNDYLGLATDRKLLESFYRTLNQDTLLDQFSPGATASRLMSGNHPVHEALENRLSALYATGRALIFNSGYHANIGLLPALAGKNDLILADKLCHASLIDGMRLSRARVIRYPHLAYGQLAEILAQQRENFNQVFIVTESIFSMDGDIADLQQILRLKQAYQAILYVDEAHAVGIRGQKGLGCAEEQEVLDQVDLLMGAFGKAYGCQGAFVISSPLTRKYLINTARSFIFTTGLPPVSLSWLLFLLDRIPDMLQRRQMVQKRADELRNALSTHGIITGGTTHIVPVMIGDAAKAMQVANRLRVEGFWINAVRPPTVPSGTARLRLSITAAMKKEDLAPLPGLIARELR